MSASQGHFPRPFAVDAFGMRFRMALALSFEVSEDKGLQSVCRLFGIPIGARWMELNMVRAYRAEV